MTEKSSWEEGLKKLAEQRETRIKEAIQPSLDLFDESLEKTIIELDSQEAIPIILAICRALFERTLRLEYEINNKIGML